MTWLFVGAMLPSLLITWAVAHLVRRVGPRLGFVDHPGHRKVHEEVMPTGGGVAIWLGVVGPFAAGQVALWILLAGDAELASALPEFIAAHLPGLAEKSSTLWGLLAGGTVLMLLGLADDRWQVDWKVRLGVQTVVAVVMVRMGWRASLYIDSPAVTGTLSVLWIVGLINSFNMLDNMDALSAGVAAIAAAMLAAVMLLAPDPLTGQPQLFVGGFLLVLLGALAGFLIHNRPPARLFMGDAGSYLIGYLLAMATLSATYAGENVPPHAVLAPLCVLAVPLYDTITVLTIRLRRGQSPFVGDKNHFSHRLVRLGMTRPQAVGTIYLTTATCGLGALLLHQVNGIGACIILALVTCMLVLVSILETVAQRDRSNERDENGDGPT